MKFFLSTTILCFILLYFLTQENIRLTNENNQLKQDYETYKPLKELFDQTKEIQGKCLEKSKGFIELARQRGIQAEIKLGESPNTLKDEKICHAWIAIYFEPQTGQLTKDYQLTNDCKE